jgi:hypothetical protein
VVDAVGLAMITVQWLPGTSPAVPRLGRWNVFERALDLDPAGTHRERDFGESDLWVELSMTDVIGPSIEPALMETRD